MWEKPLKYEQTYLDYELGIKNGNENEWNLVKV